MDDKDPFQRGCLCVFDDLVANNTRAWSNVHKRDFRDKVERPRLDLLDVLSHRVTDTDVPLRGGPKPTFKMNQDVRFGTDKSPYNSAIFALLTPKGTKEEIGGIIYVSMDQSGG